jgi:anthranilate phosphoribosyltransferase
MNTNDYLSKLADQKDLNMDESYDLMFKIMNGDVSEIALSSILTSLRIKGEKFEEIAGFVKAIREKANKVNLYSKDIYLDTCGTGGDGKKSINISTLSGITLASLGLKIVKHGNRSVSSVCGSSDLLDGLGYPLFPADEKIVNHYFDKGFVFLFAPNWHPAMKFAGNVRKELGIRTVFNLIGPLSNPLNPKRQILGVFSKSLIETFIKVLQKLSLEAAIVCHSKDGYDEFSVTADTDYAILKNGSIEMKTFQINQLGNLQIDEKDLFINSKEESIQKSYRILSGEISGGTHKIALNSGVGLYLMDKVESIEEGYKIAFHHLASGKVLNYWKQITYTNFSDSHNVKL